MSSLAFTLQYEALKYLRNYCKILSVNLWSISLIHDDLWQFSVFIPSFCLLMWSWKKCLCVWFGNNAKGDSKIFDLRQNTSRSKWEPVRESESRLQIYGWWISLQSTSFLVDGVKIVKLIKVHILHAKVSLWMIYK